MMYGGLSERERLGAAAQSSAPSGWHAGAAVVIRSIFKMQKLSAFV